MRPAPQWLLLSPRSLRVGRLLILAALAAFLPFRLVFGATLVSGPFTEIRDETTVGVRWQTDVATGGRVHFGTSEHRLDHVAEGAVEGSHLVTLTNLQPHTKYFFTVGTARQPLATNSFFTSGSAEAAPKTELKKPTPAERPPGRAPPTRETWGNVASLPDHFHRHGGDFNATNADDYARQAWEFLQRARREGLPAKIDADGVTRIFDPKTRAFAAYGRDGKTKTYFKPDRRDYFDRQPGRLTTAKSLPF